MKKKVLLWVRAGLVAVLILAVTAGGWKFLDYRKGAQDYQEAASLAFAGLDLETLRRPASNRGSGASSQGEGSLPQGTPGPSAEPEPSGEPELSAEPDPSEEPEPSAEPDPSGEPELSAEPEFSAEPELSAEPEPSEEPEPSAEPEPSVQEVDEYAQALGQLDLEALRQVNPEVVGWISIPDTDVFYPLLQTGDNQHYLNYTWKNESSSVGAIFLESTNKPDLSGFNTIVYGHQMMNGSMFGSLHEYSNYEYWKEHPSIYIVVDAGVYRYDIFSAFKVGVQDLVYRLDLEESNLQQELIDQCLSRSVLSQDGEAPEIDPQGNLLTLSTCTGWDYSTRWVVVAECTLRP